ncbi:GAF and ANTAR domain-containing protein [Modestobacter lapidis]|nr:GAF and ANTAR domain-containing protein [Modestobacter lapidis]
MIFPADERPAVAPLQLALAELSGLSFAEHSMESVLREVTVLTTRLLPAALATSVTVLSDGRPTTVAATEELALDLDLVQYRLGTGPCLQAAGSGDLVEVVDLRAERRWAGFPEQAAGRGCHGMVSIPFPPAPVAGGLNVYVGSPQVWDEETRGLATRFLTQATVPVVNRYLYESAVARARHLETAMASRAAIEQAKGILMERLKLSSERAFETLARASMAANTKLRDVADHVVATGEFPPEIGQDRRS